MADLSEAICDELDVLEAEWCNKWLKTGSRFICKDPPVAIEASNDWDYLFLMNKEDKEQLEEWLKDHDYVNENEYGSLNDLAANAPFQGDNANDGNTFCSYRKENVNVLITFNNFYFDLFSKATLLARSLNLQNKIDRIKLFDAIVRNIY